MQLYTRNGSLSLRDRFHRPSTSETDNKETHVHNLSPPLYCVLGTGHAISIADGGDPSSRACPGPRRGGGGVCVLTHNSLVSPSTQAPGKKDGTRPEYSLRVNVRPSCCPRLRFAEADNTRPERSCGCLQLCSTSSCTPSSCQAHARLTAGGSSSPTFFAMST